jgi:uncharacterized protein (TIGR02246 family)
MRYLRLVLVASFVLATLMLVGRIRVGAADADTQQTKDRADIEALMWRYVRALDTLDPNGYAAAFTEDGEFITGPNPTRGSAGLKKMVADIKSSQADRRAKGETIGPMYHVIANHSIEFLGKDQARYYAYWMTVFGPAGQGTQPRIAAVGNSVDLLVRVNGKWLIKSRNVRPTGS